MYKYECLNHWEVDSLIGEGMQGRVYLMNKKVEGKTYQSVIKEIIIPTQEQREMLRNNQSELSNTDDWLKKINEQVALEIDCLYKLKGHPNIVPIEEHYIEPHPEGFGQTYLLKMPFLKTLDVEWQNRELSKEMICSWYLHMMKALKACHQLGIFHRDIKPQNMFIDCVAGEIIYKLGDFGIATYDHYSGESIWAGGRSFQSPEQLAGKKYSSADDWFALNKLLYEMIGGKCTPELEKMLSQTIHVNVQERSNNPDAVYEGLCQLLPPNTHGNAIFLKSYSEFRQEKERYHNCNKEIKRGAVHVFISPKGTGKTTLAAMLAIELATCKKQFKVALLDLDTNRPDQFYQFDFALMHLSRDEQLKKMNGINHLFDWATIHENRDMRSFAFNFSQVDVYTRHGDIAFEASMEKLDEVIRYLTTQYDYVLLDMLSSDYANLKCNEIHMHVVTTCEPAFVMGNLKWIEGLRFNRNFPERIGLVINKVSQSNSFKNITPYVKNQFRGTNMEWSYFLEIDDHYSEIIDAKWQGLKNVKGLKIFQVEIKKWRILIEKTNLWR